MVHDTTIKVKGIPHKIENAFVKGSREHTKKDLFSKTFICQWWGRWDLNPHGINSQRILSPLRLPISPRPHIFGGSDRT